MPAVQPRIILLVDFSPEEHATLRQYLSPCSEYKYEFVEANKALALVLVETVKFDCILLNSSSERESLKVLQEFFGRLAMNKMPVILLSASGTIESVIAAFKLGVKDYLWKDALTAERFQQAVTGCFEQVILPPGVDAQISWFIALLNSLSAGVIATDVKDEIRLFNSTAEKLTGWASAEAIGQPLTYLYQLSPESPQHCNLNSTAQLSDDDVERGRPNHLILTVRDGREIPIDYSAAPIRDAFGKRHGTVIIFRDASARIHSEREREQLLQQEKQARESAEAANRGKDEFVALVSHELRNPLNSILGYTRLLQMQKNLPAQAEQMLGIIERNGKAQLQLIDDLLDTSRMISGKLKLEIRSLDLTQVLRETIEIMRPAAEAKAILISANMDAEIPLISGDPERLQQVVTNLISNALKFTPNQGEIQVVLTRDDSHLQLQVQDTGKGIEPDFLPIIFDRFVQSDVASHRRHSGLGLGLALVKHLVELHGGTVSADSAGVGLGATFTILLPLQAATAAEKHLALGTTTNLNETQPLAGIRLLVVEDEKDARELLQTVLSDLGASVTLAESAKQAYAYLTDSQDRSVFDLLISDLGMQEEDGYSLMRKIRSLPIRHYQRMPAIALTAFSRVEDRIASLRAGFQLHVMKPVDPLELSTVILALLNLRE